MIPCPDDVIVTTPAVSPTAWFILAIVLAIVVWDVWALNVGQPTVSKKILQWADKWPWFKVLGIAGMVMLTWHWFFGLPWHIPHHH